FMPLSIYKSGQGYWTRTLTAVGVGTLVISGLAWFLTKFTIRGEYVHYIQAGIVVLVLAFFAGLLWWLLNKPRIADFMIATELEMKKVAWPSRSDLINFTIVVIVGTLFMAALLWVVDLGFLSFFRWIGIIQTG